MTEYDYDREHDHEFDYRSFPPAERLWCECVMLLLYASDLHGHWPHYEALDLLCRERRPRALVLGGDLLPKEAGTLAYRIPAQAEALHPFRA